ncbi:MAG: hypothetical protein ACR2QG_07205 [Gammaproteobacteria bacterium]
MSDTENSKDQSSIDKDQVDEAAFTQRVKAMLDAEADELNAPVRSKLNQVRQAALDELPAEKSGLLAGLNWGYVSAVSLTVCMFITMWFFDLTLIEPDEAPAVVVNEDPVTVEDFDMLLSTTDLEMMSDLDFYAWLEEGLKADEEGTG